MKKIFLYSMVTVFILAPSTVLAAEKYLLGDTNFAVKMDYIVFTDDHFDDRGNEDDGLYIGLEGYAEFAPNLYIGGEVGQALNINVGGEEISFFPVELNLKYATETAPKVVADFGAGVSYSYAELRYQPLVGPIGSERDEWLFGGQVFADVTYKINWLSVGVNAKYQITEDFKDENFDLNNFRVGVQIGAMF